MELNDFTSELQAKMQEAKNPEEVLALCKEEGIELSDDDLEKVSGGWSSSDDGGPSCPVCGSTNVTIDATNTSSGLYSVEEFTCHSCGHVWTVA